MPYAFVIVVQIASSATLVFCIFRMRSQHQTIMSLYAERASTRALLAAFIDRTDGLITCDGCGRPIVADEPATVRTTPTGPMFGHTMCLPPMPERDLP